jgi:hypothetical protein
MDFIISEGGEAAAADSVIVCLTNASAWDETLQVRRIPPDKIIALSGPFVAELRGAGKQGEARGSYRGLPLFDVRQAEEYRRLVELIVGA